MGNNQTIFHTLGFKVTPKTFNKISILAEHNHHSLAEELRVALRNYINGYKTLMPGIFINYTAIKPSDNSA